ncbi:hypothetical protein CLOSBL3_20548 [Clostridiaceae bacterium BL-3]|nr:hypothetical protein CLOSBL3_20548 [Clostridiaceae bacterium BL-3]
MLRFNVTYRKKDKGIQADLNTSHVKVQLELKGSKKQIAWAFKYISC